MRKIKVGENSSYKKRDREKREKGRKKESEKKKDQYDGKW